MRAKKAIFSVEFYRRNLSAYNGYYRQDFRVLFLPFVRDTVKAMEWAKKKGIVFHYINIYDRKSRKYLGREYNNN